MYTTVLVLLRLHFILISIRVQVLGRFRQHKERRDSCRSLWATLQVQTSQDIHCTGLDNIISTGEKRIRHNGVYVDTKGKAQMSQPENQPQDTALQIKRGGQKIQFPDQISASFYQLRLLQHRAFVHHFLGHLLVKISTFAHQNPVICLSNFRHLLPTYKKVEVFLQG